MIQTWGGVAGKAHHPPVLPVMQSECDEDGVPRQLSHSAPLLDEFGNIDFGITSHFDSQGPKLGGNFNSIVVLTLKLQNGG